MGFKDARQKVIHALRHGTFQHEARRDIDVKNKLATGDVTPEFVADLLRRAKGQDHSMSPHHSVSSITVHVVAREGWYVKFYFIEPDTWFISCHQ